MHLNSNVTILYKREIIFHVIIIPQSTAHNPLRELNSSLSIFPEMKSCIILTFVVLTFGVFDVTARTLEAAIITGPSPLVSFHGIGVLFAALFPAI